MQHFITFQKQKGLFVSTVDDNVDNTNLVHQINHELMNIGYIMTKDLFKTLTNQSEDMLRDIYNGLLNGINKVIGSSGHEPIYRNFPQSVLNLTYTEFLINAIVHYWSLGTWRPEDLDYLNRECKLENVEYKPVKLLTHKQYMSIFTNILYSGTSISAFDKECIDYYIENEGVLNLSKIKFKETLAYVGKRLLEIVTIKTLPTHSATDVLRIWSVHSGGDEGLKDNCKFIQPTSRQSKLLKNTLEVCKDLEDSFKNYRELWLRLLFYLNPMDKSNVKKYPNLARHTVLLRNNPEQMSTFNAKVEKMIIDKNPDVFKLLSKRTGVFTRRLDHLARVFGEKAVHEYINANPSFMNLVTAYNHFSDRAQSDKSKRTTVLASKNKSKMILYDALEPMDAHFVKTVQSLLYASISQYKSAELENKKVYIDQLMYYTPISLNNRASSLSFGTNAIGTTTVYTSDKTLRMYVHWEGNSDIDLSAMLVMKDDTIWKVGWNGTHKYNDSVLYSGDNTGYADKNAEYIDINVKNLSTDVEWIILDANIYSGPYNFKGYCGKCHAGWMEVEHPEANQHWQPNTLSNALVLNNGAKNAYLMAFHAPTSNIVYLDLENGNSRNVTTVKDAFKMKIFLESFITLNDGTCEIKWNKLNQGHLLHILSDTLVDDKEEADVVFSEDSTLEEVSRILTRA